MKHRDHMQLDESDELHQYLRDIELSFDQESLDAYLDDECPFKLYPFQKEFVYWVNDPRVTRQACLNATECGLGKSVMALAAILASNKEQPLIILCPKNAINVWKEHLTKFNYSLPILTKLEPGLNCCLLTYESLNPTLAESNAKKISLEAMNTQFIKNTIIIADEFHKTKSSKTKLTKRFRKLFSIITKKGGKCIALTATPIMNRPNELKTLLDNLDLFKLTFGNAAVFNDLYGGVFNFQRKFMVWDPTKRKPEEIKARIREVFFIKKKKDVLDQLPTIINSFVKIDLKQKYAKELPKVGTAASLLANTDSPEFQKYMQLRQVLADEKLLELNEELDTWEDLEKPVLVFSCFCKSVQTLGRRKGWDFIDGSVTVDRRQEIALKFNAGELKGLAVTIGTGSTALSLGASDTAVFLDLSLTPGNNYQARNRNDRINAQHETLNYIYVVSNHPFEQEMLDLILEKETLINDTF